MKLDLSNQNLRRIDALNQYLKNNDNDHEKLEQIINSIETAVFDNNFINKLEHLETYSQLKKLSLANNSLVEIRGIVKLQNLQYLNLINNSLINIDALKDLKFLAWLNISGNEIKSLAALKNNHYLQYLDASDNSISELNDLSTLNELYTLNLNGNLITTLRLVPNYLPKCLKFLFLSNNAITDLNEICYLSSLNQLEALEFQNNPCVEHKYNEIIIDYRPFILNWCVTLNYLDGTPVTKRESLKAEWLYSQGKGRHFRPGQHLLLVEYLTKCCSSSITESIDEDLRYSKILEKQQSYVVDNTLTQQDQQQSFEFVLAPSFHLNNNNNNKQTAPLTILPFNNKVYQQQQQQQQQQLKSIATNNTSFEDSDVELLNSETEYLPLSSNSQDPNSDYPSKSDILFSNLSNTKLSNNSNLNRISNPYEDYDSRPIKPLNENVFQKQLEEYKEISEEELNKIRKKATLHVRAKTVDNAKISHQKTTMKALKQHQQHQQHVQQFHQHHHHQQPPQKSHTPTQEHQQQQKRHEPINSGNNKFNFKKRSKTNDEFRLGNLNSDYNTNLLNKQANTLKSASTTSTATTTTTTLYNPDNYSPRAHDKVSKFNFNNKNNKNTGFTLKTNQNKQKQQQKQLQLFHEYDNSKLQLNEFKKANNKAKQINSINNNNIDNEGNFKSSSYIISTSTFQDRCATKIQAAWRGYYVRNCSIEVRKKFELLRYKRILDYLKYLRDNLNTLIDEHKQFCELNFEAFNTLWTLLSNIKLNETDMKAKAVEEKLDSESHQIITNNLRNSDDDNDTENSKILLKENYELKQKIKALEEQCKEFEKKLMETSNKQTTSSNNNFLSQIRESSSRISLTNTQTTQTSFEYKYDETKYLNTNNTGDLLSYTNHTTLSNYDAPSTNEQFIVQQKQQQQQQEKVVEEEIRNEVNIHPPLRVRLQKVNEKSVALKWDHNQLNSNIEISGYKIYINNIMRGAVKPTDLKALINGIQEEGEYKITVRSFYEQTESKDSNTVITRVKKLVNKSHQDNSVSESDVNKQSNNQKSTNSNINSTSTTIASTTITSSTAVKKQNDIPPQINATTSQQQQLTTTTPIIMDKVKLSSQNSPNTTFLGASSTSTSTTSNQHSTGNDKLSSPPKREKVLTTLLKERLFEKQQQQQQRQNLDENDFHHDLASRLSKHAFLSANDEKSRSPSKSPEEFVHDYQPITHLPFSNSTNFIQNRAKTKTAAVSILNNNNKLNTKDNKFDKLSHSPKDLSTLVNYKPPISPSTPPRGPSPTQSTALISPIKINNFVSNINNSHLNSSKASTTSYGFEVNNSQNNVKSTVSSLLPASTGASKHKQSKSVDLSFNLKQNLDKYQVTYENELNSNNNENNNSLTSNNSLTTTANTTTTGLTNQKNFIIKSAKFSVSEPNLSASITTKSDTSGNNLRLGNSNTKLDLVRQSLSFDDDSEDDENNKNNDIVRNNTDKTNLVYTNNKENEQNSINVNRAQRIFRIRNRLLDENNFIQKDSTQHKNNNFIETT